MGVDLRPYGKLPALAVWCFFGTCFYSFIAYQMFGERGKRNRKHIRAMLGVESPELTEEDKEWQTLINETTYSKTESLKRNSR